MKKVLLSLSLVTLSLSASAQYSWAPQSTNLASSNAPREIEIVDANTVWITVSDGAGSTYPKTFSKTVDGGSTWTSGTVTGPGAGALIGDISAIDANTAWVVSAPTGAAGTNNGIWKTTNGGAAWTRQGTTAAPYSSASFANVIHFWDANEGFTAGDPVGSSFQIFRTTNGGTTWTAVASAPAPLAGVEYGLTGVKYIKGDNIWMGTTKGRLLRSSNRGVSWTANSTPALDFGGGAAGGGVDGSSAQIAFKDANNGLLITADGAVTTAPQSPPTSVVLYSTADGGATWEPVETTGTWYFGGIDYIPGTENTYVTTGAYTYDTTLQGSAYSRDGGVTWSSIDAGDQRGTVSFFNSTTGWTGSFVAAADLSGGIFKFVGDLALAVNEGSAKNNLKVYPNPVGDVVNLTASKEVKSVTIYDLSGKKIKSTTDTKQINVSNLAKGTYILQANYGTSVENTKIIKK